MSARLDCLCAGIVVADHVADTVDRLPEPGGLVLTSATRLVVGGCASNVATDLARLEARVGVLGCVGDDVFGRHVRERLLDSGVDCTHLRTLADGTPTSTTMVINTRGDDRRFLHCVGANDRLSGEELTPERIRRCRVLYVGGYGLSANPSAEHVAAAFRDARGAGVTTVLDVVTGDVPNLAGHVAAVLPWTDYFLPNEDEARILTGVVDPLEQAAAFREQGAGTVAVTCGAAGCVLLSERECLQADAYEVEFVDGTGSGDAFTAGFVYGLLEGADARRCLELASGLGASCVRGPGATGTVFTKAELEALVRERALRIEQV